MGVRILTLSPGTRVGSQIMNDELVWCWGAAYPYNSPPLLTSDVPLTFTGGAKTLALRWSASKRNKNEDWDCAGVLADRLCDYPHELQTDKETHAMVVRFFRYHFLSRKNGWATPPRDFK